MPANTNPYYVWPSGVRGAAAARKHKSPPARHAIADVRYTAPMFIRCECGWHTEARSSLEIEALWKAHRREQGAEKPHRREDVA